MQQLQLHILPEVLYSLHYITLQYSTVHYITLHYITLHYIMLHCITLQFTTLHYITLHYITLHYNTLHYNNTLHYIKCDRIYENREKINYRLCVEILVQAQRCYWNKEKETHLTRRPSIGLASDLDNGIFTQRIK